MKRFLSNLLMYRQGDILLVKSGMPVQGEQVKPENGRIIVAHGEATGHHHSLDASKAVMFISPESILFLDVLDEAPLVHQEHADVVIPPGQYRVVRQREYTPQEPRYVID